MCFCLLKLLENKNVGKIRNLIIGLFIPEIKKGFVSIFYNPKKTNTTNQQQEFESIYT